MYMYTHTLSLSLLSLSLSHIFPRTPLLYSPLLPYLRPYFCLSLSFCLSFIFIFLSSSIWIYLFYSVIQSPFPEIISSLSCSFVVLFPFYSNLCRYFTSVSSFNQSGHMAPFLLSFSWTNPHIPSIPTFSSVIITNDLYVDATITFLS